MFGMTIVGALTPTILLCCCGTCCLGTAACCACCCGAAAASGKAEADSPKNNEGDAVDAVVVVRDVDPAEESV